MAETKTEKVKTPIYTYVDFANEAIDIANGGTVTDLERFVKKAQALLDREAKRKEYAANNPKSGKAKGPSEKTLARVEALRAVLTSEPQTGAELSKILGWNVKDTLGVPNTVRYIDEAEEKMVIRETVNSQGLRAEKLYKAYFIPAE